MDDILGGAVIVPLFFFIFVLYRVKSPLLTQVNVYSVLHLAIYWLLALIPSREQLSSLSFSFQCNCAGKIYANFVAVWTLDIIVLEFSFHRRVRDAEAKQLNTKAR